MGIRLNIKKAEEKTGYTRQTIWKKCKDGAFPAPHYIGNRRFWYEEEIDNWLELNIRSTPTHINFVPKNKSIVTVAEPEQ